MNAILIGAGFSKWAADLPVVDNLFDYNIVPFGPTESRRLNKVHKLKKNWDKLYPNKNAEEFIADALIFPPSHKSDILWYIVRRLTEPFLWTDYYGRRKRRHTLMIDENRKNDLEGVLKARKFILPYLTQELQGIITTNYDLLLEYALGTRIFNYGKVGQVLEGRGAYPVSQYKNPVILQGNIPIAKLHGSVSFDDQGAFTDGRGGITGNALIIAPSKEKSSDARLANMWALSSEILQKSQKLIVFGFSFNPIDEAILNHLGAFGSNISQIKLIDPKPQLDRAQKIWPKAIIEAYDCPIYD